MAKRTFAKPSGPYKVEKNIPLQRKKKTHTRFPFDQMKVGDSFYVPKKDQDQLSAMGSLHSAVNSYNKTYHTSIKIATRRDEDGLRVWRVEDRVKKKKP